MMNPLADYVMQFAERGECKCTLCIDAASDVPKNHTVDIIFFGMSAKPGADAEKLRILILEHGGYFGTVDLFDGKEHSYLEIGGWIGDQGLALMLMGLGTALGLWKLLTPRNQLGSLIDEDMVQRMAGAGMITIQASN